MELNKSIAEGKWLEIKGEVQKAWGKLTDDELEKNKGDLKAIGGLIQQKYGESAEHFNDKLSKIMTRFGEQKDDVVDKVKKSLKS